MDSKNTDNRSSTPPADELRELGENLYKHSLELVVKNKTLSLLGQLYEIGILTLTSEELSKKITDTIQASFNFEFVGILLYNRDNIKFKSFSYSTSDKFEFSKLGMTDLDSASQALNNDFISGVLQKKEMGYTEKLGDVWKLKSDGALKKIESESHVKSSLVFPLVNDRKIIGIFILSLNKIYNDLVNYEKESINSFINVISISIDKSIIYQELKEANENLERANEGQTNLIHIINHQIKGYLAKSRNIFSEILGNKTYGPIPEQTVPMVEEGFKSLTEGVDYVQKILTSSNAERGTLEYKMAPLDFKALVAEAIEKQRESAEKKELKLESELGEGEFQINGDSSQLKEAVRNLIDNSIIYTKEGSVKVSLEKKPNKIVLTVQDTGIGITEDDKKRLFTKGGRGKDSTRMNANSSGFGLAFVKGVIEAHKGSISASSSIGPNHGSTFTVEIPLE